MLWLFHNHAAQLQACFFYQCTSCRDNYSSVWSNRYASLKSYPLHLLPCLKLLPLTNSVSLRQTLQMGIKHFSGLFVMLCVGVALSLLTTIAEHIVYKLVIPRVKEPRFKYWLHTSQVLNSDLHDTDRRILSLNYHHEPAKNHIIIGWIIIQSLESYCIYSKHIANIRIPRVMLQSS